MDSRKPRSMAGAAAGTAAAGTAGVAARSLAGVLARGYGLFGCALLGVAAWAIAILEGLDDPMVWGEALNAGGVNILVGLGMALSGQVLIAHHRPRSLGWLLLAGGAGRVLADAVPAVVSAAGLPSQAALAASVVVVAVSVTAYYLALYAVPLFLPAGRLPGRGAVAGFALLAALSTVEAVRDTVLGGDWYAIEPVTSSLFTELQQWDPWSHPLIRWVPAVAVGASLTVMAVSWRRSATRDTPSAPLLAPYLLWLGMWLFGNRLYPLGLPLWGMDALWYADAAIWPTLLGCTAARDRSRHLDRSARRLLSSFILAIALVAGYLTLTALLYLVLQPSPVVRPLILGTVALALGALLQPAARWSARVVDRYYYGDRAKPYQSVRALAEQLSKAADPADAPRALCATAVHTLGLPGARLVAHIHGGGVRELAAAGTSVTDSGGCFPLSHRGMVIGHLIVASRLGEPALDRQDTETIKLLAAHAAPAVAAVRLYEDLHSHQELLLAREEERRRLRHELHDGSARPVRSPPPDRRRARPLPRPARRPPAGRLG